MISERPIWFDRDGQPVSIQEWTDLRSSEEYIRVASTYGPGERWWVSTVWIGIDMGFRRSGPPVIFETMVFGGPLTDECFRYATEAEAHAGHEVIVATVEQAVRRQRLAGMSKHKHVSRRRTR